MKKKIILTEEEKLDILSLHKKTPIKSWVFEQQVGFEAGPGGMFKPKQTFNPNQYKKSLEDKGIKLVTDPLIKEPPTAKAVYGPMPKDIRGTKEMEIALDADRKKLQYINNFYQKNGRYPTKDDFQNLNPIGMSLEEMFDWFKWGIKWFGPGGNIVGTLLDALGGIIKGIQAYLSIKAGKDTVVIVSSIFGSISDIMKACKITLPTIPYITDIIKKITKFIDSIGFDKYVDSAVTKMEGYNASFLTKPKWMQASVAMLVKYGWKYIESGLLFILENVLNPLETWVSGYMPKFGTIIKSIILWVQTFQKLGSTAEILINKPDVKGLLDISSVR